jgi:hypothetical protein
VDREYRPKRRKRSCLSHKGANQSMEWNEQLIYALRSMLLDTIQDLRSTPSPSRSSLQHEAATKIPERLRSVQEVGCKRSLVVAATGCRGS